MKYENCQFIEVNKKTIGEIQNKEEKSMKIKDIYVIKKDGTKQSFDGEKIVRAINASAKRIGETLSAEDEERTVELVLKNIHEAEVPILTMHSLVEEALDAGHICFVISVVPVAFCNLRIDLI